MAENILKILYTSLFFALPSFSVSLKVINIFYLLIISSSWPCVLIPISRAFTYVLSTNIYHRHLLTLITSHWAKHNSSDTHSPSIYLPSCCQSSLHKPISGLIFHLLKTIQQLPVANTIKCRFLESLHKAEPVQVFFLPVLPTSFVGLMCCAPSQPPPTPFILYRPSELLFHEPRLTSLLWRPSQFSWSLLCLKFALLKTTQAVYYQKSLVWTFQNWIYFMS